MSGMPLKKKTESLAETPRDTYLGLNFIIEKLLLEVVKGVVSTVVVQIQWIENVSAIRQTA